MQKVVAGRLSAPDGYSVADLWLETMAKNPDAPSLIYLYAEGYKISGCCIYNTNIKYTYPAGTRSASTHTCTCASFPSEEISLLDYNNL